MSIAEHQRPPVAVAASLELGGLLARPLRADRIAYGFAVVGVLAGELRRRR